MKRLLSFIIVLLFYNAGFSQNLLDFRSNLRYSETANDIWGYTDTAGNEYAIIGLQNGTSIVDVTDPDSVEELFFIEGPNSIWRDMKTFNDHAYITHDYTEDSVGTGLLIIDLIDLPASIDTHTWTGNDSLEYTRAHNIYIDENGIVYLFGSNLFEGGAIFLDVNDDPMVPEYVGNYSTHYIHDGFVRGDTMWASEIYEGIFTVVNVSNKQNPITIASNETPFRFTHNCWLSDDGHFLFTTDERSGAPVAAYDVSDLSNIKETDQYFSSPGSGVIPHNVTVLNNFLIISYYRDGVRVVDATDPGNLVETEYFDTSPFDPDDGFQGCWGVYPYLPSGNILASDREEGLFVLTPSYNRAGYLEGTITNDTSGAPLSNIQIEILGTDYTALTDISGEFKAGVADSGNYDIRITNPGCHTKIISEVIINPGQVTTLNESLACTTLTTGIIDRNIIANPIILQAYPTVFTGLFNIKYDASAIGNEKLLLQIFNLQGQLVDGRELNNQYNTVQIDGSKYAEGVYFVTLASSKYQKTIKVIKAYGKP